MVIEKEWLDKIVAGEKTWELRSRPHKRVVRGALCEKGGPIVATCTIGQSIELSRENFAANFDKHRVPSEELDGFFKGRQIHAWPLSDVRRIEPPIQYQHPGGGSWVKLSGHNVRKYARLGH